MSTTEDYSKALGLIREATKDRAPFHEIGPKLLDVKPFSAWKGHTIADGHTGGGMEFKGDSALGVLKSENMEPETLLAHFADLITRNAARFHHVVLVQGVAIKKPISMGQFTLAPLTDLPRHSGIGEMIFSAPEHGYILGLGQGRLGPEIPVAMLRSEYEISPVAFPMGAFPSDTLQAKQAPVLLEAVDCVRALSVASTSPLAAPVVFHESVEPGLRSRSRRTLSILPDGPLQTPADVDFDLAVDINKQFNTFNGLNRLRLAIDMFYAARLQTNFLLKVVALGTALEIAVLGDSQAELSFRLAIRVAWLLGDDAASRQEEFKLARALYDCRSKAVHQGMLKEFPRPEWEELVRRVLLAIVYTGQFPDWKKTVLDGASEESQ